MNVPKILEDSVNVLRDMVDNVEDLALLNALNSKIANLVSLKGCLFRQYNNSPTRTMSYYCMSFMHSGTNKDYMVDCINDYLLPFIEDEFQQELENYKQQYEMEQTELRRGKKDSEKDIKAEIEKLRVPNFEIANPNYTGLYREAEQIHKVNFGSLYIRMGEFGDYIDNIASGDKTKKEVYQKLKDIFEGTFYPSLIAGDGKRETYKNIGVQIYLYTDFENLYENKNKHLFINSLKTGMARRCFIYIPRNEDKALAYPKRPIDKEEAHIKAIDLRNRFKTIYDNIQRNTVYDLSEEAKDLLYNYQCDCIDYFNKSKDNMIIKLERKESFWKITKLAVIYSIIDNPTATVVKSKYVQMAIDFYNAICPSLKTVIEKRKKSEIEEFAEYMANKPDHIVTRTELRQLNLVNGNKFKHFFEEHLEEIKEELENTYGYAVYNYEGQGNAKAYQLMKVNE